MEATDPEELRAYVSFAKRVARNLLFPYIWIRYLSPFKISSSYHCAGLALT